MIGELATSGGPARLDVTRPRAPAGLLVLTHGAAGDVDTADLLAVRAGAVSLGWAVALLTQPYRVAGRRAPPAAGAQDAAWTDAIGALRRRRGLGRLPLVLGGRSNGARVACRTADALGAAGVVGLAFPLHPPGRPDRSRLTELALPRVPVLVVQGDRDPFGLPPTAQGRTVVVIERADHGLRRDPGAVGRAVTEFLATLTGR